MRVMLYEVDNGPCPYLPDRRWMTHSFTTDSMDEATYEQMLTSGWRRSGTNFYQNHCPGCSCCTPLRVPVHGFQPSRSQRRSSRRNMDVRVHITQPSMENEVVDLYLRYVQAQHGRSETAEQLERYLAQSPLETRVMLYRVGGKLVGVGWVDVLKGGISSVYFAFEPDEARRSLGTFSFMQEMELAKSLKKRWLYMGFYVPGSPKMAYKARFRPCEFAVEGRWTPDESRIECV